MYLSAAADPPTYYPAAPIVDGQGAGEAQANQYSAHRLVVGALVLVAGRLGVMLCPEP